MLESYLFSSPSVSFFREARLILEPQNVEAAQKDEGDLAGLKQVFNFEVGTVLKITINGKFEI